LASSLATRGVENGALGSYAISLLGHVILALLLFLFHTPGRKMFVEDIPRSVKLIATLDTPRTPPPRKAVKAPSVAAPKPAPKPAPPKTVPTDRPPPPPAPAPRIEVPSREAPPLITPRKEPQPRPSPFGEKLASRLSDIQSRPVEAPVRSLPKLDVPEISPLEVPTKAPPPSIVAGGEEIVPLTEFPYAWYIALVKDRIFNEWSPPSSFSLGGRRITAIASFRITRQGRLEQVRITDSSGHRLFDQSVLATLDGLAGLPPLPGDYREDFLDVFIRFQSDHR